MRICPFCGYDEGWLKETSYSKPIKYRVECNVCGAIGPEAKTYELAEKKWDGLLAQIKNQEKFEEALEEEMGGVSAPAATLVNTPGVGSAIPASTAAMTGAQQTSSSALGSGDKWGDGPIYDQNGKLKSNKKKKKKGKKKVSENNINPYDKIAQMMAKRLGVPQQFKKKDYRTNTVEQIHAKEAEEPNFEIPSYEDYSKNLKKIHEDYSKNPQKLQKINEEDLRDENALKDIKGKDILNKLGISYEYKPGKSGKNRVFITEPMKDILIKLKQGEWNEIGRNPKNTIRKFQKEDKILTIYADGKDLPRATVTSGSELKESYIIRKVVSNSLDPYIK